MRTNQVRAIKSLIDFVMRIYYSILFHANKILEVCRRPVNMTVDAVTIIASIWCIGNVIWQIGFDVSPETSMSLLNANRQIIGLFAFIQVYKIINYIRASDFSPLQSVFKRVNTAPFRKVARKSMKAANGIFWRKVARHLSPKRIGRFAVNLFRYLFVGNRVPLTEILYAVGNCLYWWYMPDIDVHFGDWQDYLWHKYTVSAVVCFIAVNEISRLGITILGRKTSPTVLFIGSFLIIIAIGCGLLLMPNSNNGDMTFFEALFTATSAVCVNGLSIIDIPNDLTFFGHVILLILIQVGGIGVMTFTCFLALSLTGRASLQNRFVIKDLVSVDNMTDIFQTLKRIFLVTIVTEAISAYAIFNYMEPRVDGVSTNMLIFYSVFHSISAFCNAGFSNIDGGMMNPLVAGIKPIQIIISLTVIFGGLGFPLQSSVIDWVKHHVKRFICRLFNLHGGNDIFRSRLINANNRIVFYTHILLIFAGMIIFMLTENRFTQSGADLGTKMCDSFFMSVNARTAGFCLVDITHFGPLTMIVLTLLMWIGCAPLSTGGGIKVTTFAIAVLNVKSVLQRRDRTEIYGRRISEQSIRKAFAVIILSGLMMITCAITYKVIDPQIPMIRLIFESCSALFTGGMTMDVTTKLSMASHIVLLVEMFVGRIGILAFMLCFIDPAPKQHYRYPDENIMV